MTATPDAARPTTSSPAKMTATEKVTRFLRACQGNVPKAELFRLKAEAFEAMASEARADGDMRFAVQCDERAAVARREVV